MKKLLLLLAFLVYFIFPSNAKTQDQFLQDLYVISSFESKIELQKGTSLKITETIQINFPDARHGIFRRVPLSYQTNAQTINADFRLVSITDENGNSYMYERERSGQYVQLKIGDPEKTITGLQTYVITYVIDDVVIRYDTHDEIYWNVTGSEWDTEILNSSASVISPFAEITNVECFAGAFDGRETFCTKIFSQNKADFVSTTNLGPGRDFTIVVVLDKENELVFPGKVEKSIDTVLDNWGYFVALLPFLTSVYFWLKKGRDMRFIGENVYYNDGKGKITKPLFVREYLPTVYYPIQELSPAEVGTIVDERVDIDDVVAEIVELARLGYLKIEKTKKRKIIFNTKDYKFIKLEKDLSALADYQFYLLDKLFDGKDEMHLSDLKNKFYKHLEDFKKKLYKSLNDERLFDGAPDTVRTKWIGILIAIDIVAAILLSFFMSLTGNIFPLIALGILSIPTFLFAFSMPRRTARGYSFYRQIKGLNFYLEKGKWREEIAEKHLFFGEMLPIAIALGIVNKLSKDMEDLGVMPPNYFTGVTTSSLSSDISGFASSASSDLRSAPGGKGGSWSGGSGFSGGSSGGGFGGGGGGSW